MKFTSPLAEACKNYNLEIVKFLLELGADPQQEIGQTSVLKICVDKLLTVCEKLERKLPQEYEDGNCYNLEYLNYKLFDEDLDDGIEEYYLRRNVEELFEECKEILKLLVMFSSNEGVVNYCIDNICQNDYAKLCLFKWILPKCESVYNTQKISNMLYDRMSDSVSAAYIGFVYNHMRDMFIKTLDRYLYNAKHGPLCNFFNKNDVVISSDESLKLIKDRCIGKNYHICRGGRGYCECGSFAHDTEWTEDVHVYRYNHVVRALVKQLSVEHAREFLLEDNNIVYRSNSSNLFDCLVSRITEKITTMNSILALAELDEIEIFKKYCQFKFTDKKFRDEFIEKSGPRVREFILKYNDLYN